MFEDLTQLLAQHPGIKFTLEKDSLRVLPITPNGYEAIITQHSADRHTVWFGAWHEEFRDYSSARDCFLFGLSDRCRLKVFRKGRVPFRWVVEYRKDAEWITDSTTGLLFYPFWRRTTIEYLTNNSLTEQLTRAK